MEQLIISFITILIPSITTLITNNQLKKSTDMHSARQSILQLIVEDHIRVSENKLPENYKAICTEFDEYVKNNGNSYIHKKVEDYFEWYEEATDKINGMTRSKS